MKKIKKVFYFILFLSFAVGLIFFNKENNLNFLKNLNFKISDIGKKPFLYAGDQLNSVKLFFLGINDLKNKNNILREENIKLQSVLVDFEKIKKENDIFRNTLKIKNEKNLNLVFAEVIFKASQAVGDYFIINKGENAGLKIGQPVIINEIIVGKISEVYEDYAKVFMLNNPSLKLSAVIQADEESVKGLAEGYLSRSVKMKLIEKGKKISIGDLVVTSGIDEKIPFGFLIGRVDQIKNSESAVFQESIIKLPLGLEQINEAFVVVKN